MISAAFQLKDIGVIFGGTATVLATGLFGRRQSSVSSDSVVVKSAESVVVMLTGQMVELRAEVDALRAELNAERLARRSEATILNVHIANLEASIRSLGGTPPQRP